MTKIDAIKFLLEQGYASSLYDLLRGLSEFTTREAEEDLMNPSIELTKLIGIVRNHLYFISKYGEKTSRVTDNGCHYFAYPQQFDEWLSLDAPGVSVTEVMKLYEAITGGKT